MKLLMFYSAKKKLYSFMREQKRPDKIGECIFCQNYHTNGGKCHAENYDGCCAYEGIKELIAR